MMAVCHNGYARTMKAHYTVQEGDLRLIRPFVFTRERDLRAFAADPRVRLPVISENCPACFEEPKVRVLCHLDHATHSLLLTRMKERHRFKNLLATQELLFPNLYHSLRAAMLPFMAKSTVGTESRRSKAAAAAEHDDDDDDA
jgi:hypothetical protein